MSLLLLMATPHLVALRCSAVRTCPKFVPLGAVTCRRSGQRTMLERRCPGWLGRRGMRGRRAVRVPSRDCQIQARGQPARRAKVRTRCPVWAGTAVADRPAFWAGDGHAYLGVGAGCRRGGYVPGEGGVEQAEALDFPRLLGEPEQRDDWDD